jgi:CBS domain-containing protein
MIAKDLLKTNFVKVDKEDTISKLIGNLKRAKKTEAVVLDGKKYIGVVCKRKLLRSRRNVNEEKVRKIIIKPAVLHGGESVEHVAALMNSSDVHMLPVVNKGFVEGVIYAVDVLKHLDEHVTEKKASEFLKGKVIAFHEDTEIGKAMHDMRERKIDRAPVVNEQSKLVGIVSIIDLALKYSIFPMERMGGKNIREAKSSTAKERAISELPVENELTPDVVTAKPNDRIKTVVKLMAEHDISCVVIVDDFNEPVGIITIKDILKLF